MQHRIDRLEGLVLSLMTNGNDSVGPTEASRSLSMSSSSQQFTPSQPDDSFHNGEGESETEKVAKSLGVMHVANNKVAYLGDAHWSTILNDVRFGSCVDREANLTFADYRSEELFW